MFVENSRYTIKVVAERTGVSLHTLRAWERRYGVPKPRRSSENQYRLYGDQDIADVLWMKRQIEQGIAPSQAGALLRARTQDPLLAQSVSTIAASARPLDATRMALEAALLEPDANRAQQLLDTAFALFAPEQLALQVIGPAMQSIGERWMTTENAVWQEHFASNLVRQRIQSILQSQAPVQAGAPVLIAACAPDEQHELGLLIFALLARRQGWGVSYLGQRTPLVDLALAAHAIGAQLIALSVTSLEGLASLVPLFAQPDLLGLPRVLGGSIINRVPSLHWHLPGVFAGADAAESARGLDQLAKPTELWSPPKRLLRAALELRAQRQFLAGETTAIVQQQAGSRALVRIDVVSQATLHLADLLACALAFDVPELMDDQAQWVHAALGPRGVTPLMLRAHQDAFSIAAQHALGAESAKAALALLDRLVLPSAESSQPAAKLRRT